VIRTIYSIAIACCLVACGSQPKTSQPQPTAPKPTIKSIAIVPATAPQSYTLANASTAQFFFPIAQSVISINNKANAKAFNEKLSVHQSNLANSLTESVAAALRGHGYNVQVLSNVVRPTEDPDDIDYDKLTYSADAVLHLSFTEVGLYSPRSSDSYLPRINAKGVLFAKGVEDDLYNEEIRYGVDARDGKPWAIAADKIYSFPNFNELMNRLDTVEASFQAGVREISKLLSEQVHVAIK
jgi:hypothetical protein